MNLVTIESEAYYKLQQDNFNYVRSLLQEERAEPTFGWLTNKQAAAMLGVSFRTLQSWRDAQLLGFSQVGSKIYYRYEHIEQFLLGHYNKPFKTLA